MALLRACRLALAMASASATKLLRPPPHRLAANDIGCDLSGDYRDTSFNMARLKQTGDTFNVSSLSSGTGWQTAQGAVSPDGKSLWMCFGSCATNLTATWDGSCSNLYFSNGQTWMMMQPMANITTVHVVFMTHLDLGYTNLARNICDEYFNTFFPAGWNLSSTLRAMGGPAQYAVTSHPWLILEFLNGTTQCAHSARNASMITSMERAIANGDVRWHGKPMNNFVELEDGPWFASSLQMSAELNARYGKSWGSVACKSTDVPGMSKSSLPYFAAAGKRALHIGFNSACKTAHVPQGVAFNWVHEDTGTALLTFVENNYGSYITVPGSSHALAFFYSPDNTGPPPSAEAVVQWWNATQALFSSAQLVLSSLDDFALAILPMSESLPQFTGEMGQSWSYGAPADPLKIAAFRAARNLRNRGVAEGWLDPTDRDLIAYERRLYVGGPEHNWGASFGSYVPGGRSPSGNWSNELFHAVQNRADYQFIVSANVEKRNFTLPLPTAPNATVSAGYERYLDALAAELAQLLPSAPDMSSYTRMDPSQSFTCGRFSDVRFSAANGAITSLVDASTGYQWINSTSAGLGAFTYRTYTEADFDIWNKGYNPGCGPPCGDFAKPGMDSASPVSAVWQPSLTGLYQRTGGGCSFLAQLALDPQTVSKYGGMTSLWLNVTVDPTLTPAPNALPTIYVELNWMNKTATRLAESMWLSFVPSLPASADVSGWRMDVLGHDVSPLEVVEFGTRHIHAVWDGVRYDGRASGGPYVNIHTIDSPLVSPEDTDHLLFYDGLTQPNLEGGWHFNIYNNVWGTGECSFPLSCYCHVCTSG